MLGVGEFLLKLGRCWGLVEEVVGLNNVVKSKGDIKG